MNKYLYGKLNTETIVEKYKSSDTIRINEDNKTINVVKTPGTLTVRKKKSETEFEELGKFNGQQDTIIDLSEVDIYTPIETKTTKTNIDFINNKISVDTKIDNDTLVSTSDNVSESKIKVKKLPNKLRIYQDDELTEFDGSEPKSIYFTKTQVIDDLEHTDIDKALSANQGKVLKDLIDSTQSTLNEKINSEISRAKDAEETIVTKGQGIKLEEVTGGKLKFTNTFIEDPQQQSVEVQGGFLPDETTIELTNDKKLKAIALKDGDGQKSYANIHSEIENKLTKSKANRNIVENIDISISGDTVNLTEHFVNLETQVQSQSAIQDVIPAATIIAPGLMTSEDKIEIQNLRNDVNILKGTTIRLLYTEKQDPTSEEIEAFVSAQYPDSEK